MITDEVAPTKVPEQSSSSNNEGAHVLSEPLRQQNLESAQGQSLHAHGESSSSQTSNKVPKWLNFGKIILSFLYKLNTYFNSNDNFL